MNRVDRSNHKGTNTIEYMALTGFILVVVIASGFVPRVCVEFNKFFDKVVQAMR